MRFFRKGRHRKPSRPKSPWRAIILGFFAVMLIEAWVAWYLRESAPDLGPPPDPNGYNDLVRAAAELAGAPPAMPTQFIPPDDADDQPAPIGPGDVALESVDRLELRAYLDRNQQVFARMRLGLNRDCRVPVKFVRGYARGANGTRDSLRKLAELLRWDAWLAESEDRHKDAARDDLDLVRMGVAVSYGGLETDAWFGYDLLNGGLAGLRRRLHRLDAEPCLDAMKQLAKIDAARESYAHVIARQKEYDRAEGGQVPVAIMQLVSFRARRLNREMTALAEEVVANLRLTRIELALRVYRIRHGEEPNSLNDLSPGILREIPFDPFSGQPFLYSRTKKGHRLYSIGPDGRDDEGARLEQTSFPPKGDVSPNTLISTFEPIIAR